MKPWPGWHCPSHGAPLLPRDGGLSCQQGDDFPIRDGIPRFVPPANYAEAFGSQWKRYRRTQLDSHTGVPLSRNRARRAIGEEAWSRLRGQDVLECGCGAGRFTEVLLEEGARLTSVDLSEAVDANLINFPCDDGHRLAQADIMHLPFAPRSFDMVFCLGVVQHTPSPEATLENLYRQVRPGGLLVVDHYTRGLSWFTKSAALLRYYYRRLPAEEGLRATERLVDRFLPFHRAVRRFRAGQMLVSRVSPVLCYYHTFPQFSDEMQREWALLDTHDSLTCWFRHVRTRGQIRRALQALGACNVWSEYGENGVVARAERPSGG